MHLAPYLTLLFPLASWPLARLAGSRLHPRSATWVMTTAAVLLAGTSCGALGLLTVAAVVRLPGVTHLAHLSGGVIRSGDTTSYAVAVVAGCLFGAAVLMTIRFTLRATGAIVASFRFAKQLPGSQRLVVTPQLTPDAYAVPGMPGRVVVSTAMFEALDPPSRRALLAHEHAHIEGQHYLFTSIVGVAATANPLVRPLAAAVDFTVERWADERAASSVGSRRQVAEAVAHAAVASQHHARIARPVLGMAITGPWRTDVRRAGPIPRRVAALLAPRPTSNRLVLAVIAALVAAASACALEAANDLQDLLVLARAHYG